MRRLIAICGVIAFLCVTNGAIADIYVQTVGVYKYGVGGGDPADDVITWNHTYDFSVDTISKVFLTVVADDVDGPDGAGPPELDMVKIQDFAGTWHDLGFLNDLGTYTSWNYHPGPGNPQQGLTSTVFELDPSWVRADMPIAVHVDPTWGVEIETSTLSVIPAPGAALLAVLGLSAAGMRLRRRFA